MYMHAKDEEAQVELQGEKKKKRNNNLITMLAHTAAAIKSQQEFQSTSKINEQPLAEIISIAHTMTIHIHIYTL